MAPLGHKKIKTPFLYKFNFYCVKDTLSLDYNIKLE